MCRGILGTTSFRTGGGCTKEAAALVFGFKPRNSGEGEVQSKKTNHGVLRQQLFRQKYELRFANSTACLWSHNVGSTQTLQGVITACSFCLNLVLNLLLYPVSVSFYMIPHIPLC